MSLITLALLATMALSAALSAAYLLHRSSRAMTRSRSRTPRSRTPRSRGGSSRVARPQRARGGSSRASVRGRGRGATILPVWKIAAATAALVSIGVAAYALEAFKAPAPASLDAARHIIYTAQTAEDAPLTLPVQIKADLLQVGLNHQKIALSRIDATGDVTTSLLDLTARVDDKPNSPALIPERARPVIQKKIADIESTINTAKASAGSRTLFTGLTRIDFTGVPAYLVSSGLDLVDPVAFPKLNWVTPAQKVIDTVNKAGEMPHLYGPVTFVVAPTAGQQEQLRAKQAAYRDAVWEGLLTAAGATSVTFIDAVTNGTASGPSSQPVALSGVPDTPIEPIKKLDNPKRATCTVPTAFFVADSEELIDRDTAVDALGPCIRAALAAGATFELDGWTSYEGPLDVNGRPAIDSPGNRKLSDRRVRTIVDLLVTGLNVPRGLITAHPGHGNTDQPVADPRSPDNRRVDITYTVK